MLASPRILALILASSIAGITTLFLSLVNGVGWLALLVCFTLAFASSFLLITVALEFLIFREVNVLYESFNKLKKKDFKFAKKRLSTIPSPLRQLNEELFSYAEKKQKEIDQLIQVEAFRKEFLADVSHELKTPIFAAQGFIHTLLDGAVDDPEVRYKFLERAAKTLDGLDHLVQDLITLSKMESGFIKMEKQSVDAVQLLEEVFIQLEEKAELKNIAFVFDKEKSPSCIVYADKQRFRQVFINLIENAIKYGKPNGHVYVSMTQQLGSCQIIIQDDGLGIPKKHLTRIFERFYRVEKSRSKERGGSGLGLAIVKQIIDAHEAQIEVQSKVDKGTTFTINISCTSKDCSTASHLSSESVSLDSQN